MTQTITFSRERTLIIPALSGRAIGWTSYDGDTWALDPRSVPA
jgi:hypothetical protein